MRALRPLLSLAGVLSAVLIIRSLLRETGIEMVKVAENPAPVLAAIIGVGGALASVMGGLTLWRLQDGARRRDIETEVQLRRRRTVAALRAEMSFNLRALRQSFDPRYNTERLEGYCAAIDSAAKGESGMPIGVSTEESVLFELNKPNLSELPEVLAEALVSYHQHDRALAQIIAAVNAGRFDAASPTRRKRVLIYYHLLGQSALQEALQARALLDAYIADVALLSHTTALETYLSEDEATLHELLGDEEMLTHRLKDIFIPATSAPARRASDKRKDRS